MYLFDREDFNCDVIPNDWEDYAGSLRYLFNGNLKCLNKLIDSKKSELSNNTWNQLQILFEEYKNAVTETKLNLSILIQALVANPSGSTCFDKTVFTNYLASYSIVKKLSQELNLLIATNGDYIGYDLNVGVGNSTIFPTSGSSKVTTCSGVYIKQMDFGSEFIGTVTVMGGFEESYFDNQQTMSDGSWTRK